MFIRASIYRIVLLFSMPLGLAIFLAAQQPAPPASSAYKTFTNPLLPSGPDPWFTSYKGTYYVMVTTGMNLTLRATPEIASLAHAQMRVAWTHLLPAQPAMRFWRPRSIASTTSGISTLLPTPVRPTRTVQRLATLSR